MTSVAGAHVRLLTLTWCYCYNVEIFNSNFALWIYRQFFPSLFSFKVCFGNRPSFEFVHGNQCCVQILVWNDTSVLQHFICYVVFWLVYRVPQQDGFGESTNGHQLSQPELLHGCLLLHGDSAVWGTSDGGVSGLQSLRELPGHHDRQDTHQTIPHRVPVR